VHMIPEISHIHVLSNHPNHAFTGAYAGDYARANG
jgi:hypothetical protein